MHHSLAARKARANRSLAVTCRTTGFPFLDWPQTWVKPRKLKLVGNPTVKAVLR
ncbi:hypothetical protein SHLA_126c000030 [Shinella sp. DD12]|nr:hypothetical protein SHLA_126c000030 [Shinella sp. DD12]